MSGNTENESPEDSSAVTASTAGDSASTTDASTSTTAQARSEEENTARTTYTVAEYRAVQNEARNLRTRLRETETSVTNHTAAREAAENEVSTLRAQMASMTNELRQYRLRDAIAEVVNTAGSDATDLQNVDVLLAAQLLEVEYDEAGQPKALVQALRKLLKKHPRIGMPVTAPRVPVQTSAAQGAARTTDDNAVRLEKRQVSVVL